VPTVWHCEIKKLQQEKQSVIYPFVLSVSLFTVAEIAFF
jgi:hypothetical protein